MTGASPRTGPSAAGSGHPPLAVAILTRNRWETADRCLAGIRDQAARAGVPIVVLVNGSDDDSAEMLRSTYPEIEVHESSTNLGCPAGRNRLTELCGASWVAYVDDDGTVGPDFVSVVLDEVAAAPADRMVIAGNIIDVKVNADATFTSGPTSRFSGGICAIRRTDFLRLGGYPADGMRQGEEGTLSIKLFADGLSIHRAGSLVLFHSLAHSWDKRCELLRTGLRQALLTGVEFCPWWMLPGWTAWKLLVHLRVAVDLRAPRVYLTGLRDVAHGLPGAWRSRSPVRARIILAASSRFGPASG